MKYEYKVLTILDKVRDEDFNLQLNELGLDGWEVISADITPIRCLCILKRELKEDKKKGK